MATKDDRPGLLSKVASFVRNPTKDWSELDKPEQAQESGYDKQALKAMIERKRQNDFVRKREFDQLRKLRSRDPATLAGIAARPSFFQTSVASDPDGRAGTLKKIDEIEAQMSKQWWKGKQEGNTRSGSLPTQQPAPDSRSSSVPSQFPTQGPSIGPEMFAPTEAIGLTPRSYASDDDRATQTTGDAKAIADRYAATGQLSEPVLDTNDQAFSASELFAIDEDELATDPELEEAAIRFANGDDAGAEKGLLDALRGEALLPEVAQSWAAALLDLYRATDNRTGFDSAVQEFGQRFERSVPAWSSLAAADLVAASTAAPDVVSAPVAKPGNEAVWRSPEILNLRSMESLQGILSSQPTPWHLDWSPMEDIAADAMPLLDGLFASLCAESVTLRFTGTDQLLRRLRALTRSGDRSVDQICWTVRLNALRAMQLQDEFELAALDYCVTFEVSPPAWINALCHFESLGAPGRGDAHWNNDSAGPLTLPMAGDGGPVHAMELRGSVVGDASLALAVLQGAAAGSQISVSCKGLIRVDFSAAGNILNWVATRQAEGSQVQFRDVHRLVAAFFNVIGINEHARVVPRPI